MTDTEASDDTEDVQITWPLSRNLVSMALTLQRRFTVSMFPYMQLSLHR